MSQFGGGGGNRWNPRGDEFERFRQLIIERPTILVVIFSLLVGLPVIFSSFYTVEPDEEAVILRFGRYIETTPPGLHFKLPLGVDEAIKVKTKLILQQEFGFRSENVRGGRTSYSEALDDESLMLTGDLNVADVEWITQFQISDPKKFLFHTRDPIRNIRDVSEAVMRRVVGDRLVTDVLTVGRVEIASEAMSLIQGIVDQYDRGVRVVSIKLQDVNPPDAVKPSFNEVNAAKQEQEQAINQAEKHYNEVIPEAKGRADKDIAMAQGYATALLNRSKGDADRFELVLQEYRRAPTVTRERLYLETMERVFMRLEGLTLVDESMRGGLLPIFDQLKGGKDK
ncbi:MAG: FtsH protease activity modulator HflK [Bdellovibrionales bacterium]|nr:FtsH protease activity modulator HflK [Bdellovibrionales bacterium]